jgi:hypothetical protein
LLTVSSTLAQDVDAVHVVIAKRGMSFEDRHAATWPEYCRDTQMMALCAMPTLPTRFPRLTVEVVGADTPGIQVCDFVLWALQRATLNGTTPIAKGDWLNRLGLRITEAGGRVQGAHQLIVAELGAWKRRFYAPAFSTFRELESLHERERYELLVEIATNVRVAAALAVTSDRIAHLAKELNAAVLALRELHAISPSAGEAAHALMRAFLLLCDTLPIYDMNDAPAYARACEKRLLAAAVMRGESLWLPLAGRI